MPKGDPRKRKINGRFVHTRRPCELEVAILQAGYTRREFAAKIGTTAPQVNKWCVGDRCPSLFFCVLIGAVLQKPLDDVVRLLIASGHKIRTTPFEPGEKMWGSRGFQRKKTHVKQEPA